MMEHCARVLALRQYFSTSGPWPNVSVETVPVGLQNKPKCYSTKGNNFINACFA